METVEERYLMKVPLGDPASRKRDRERKLDLVQKLRVGLRNWGLARAGRARGRRWGPPGSLKIDDLRRGPWRRADGQAEPRQREAPRLARQCWTGYLGAWVG